MLTIRSQTQHRRASSSASQWRLPSPSVGLAILTIGATHRCGSWIFGIVLTTRRGSFNVGAMLFVGRVAPLVWIAALALTAAACGASKPAATQETMTGDAPTASTVSGAASAPTPERPQHRLQRFDSRRPWVDGYWLATYVPVPAKTAAEVVRGYWQIRRTCNLNGRCLLDVDSRVRAHGVRYEGRITYQFDSANGDYHRRHADPVPTPGPHCALAGRAQRLLKITTFRHRGHAWVATRMSARDWPPGRLFEHNCHDKAQELYRIVLVRASAIFRQP